MRAAARSAHLLVIVIAIVGAAAANDTNAARSLLEQQFKGKVLLIRHFYAPESLKYDASGNVLESPAVGPWTEAHFSIDKIDVKADHFRLTGRRIVSTYSGEQNKFLLVQPRNKPSIEIEVAVPASQLTAEKIAELQKAIFATDIQSLRAEVPPYWLAYFDGRVVQYKDKNGRLRHRLKLLDPDAEAFRQDVSERLTPIATLANGEPLYKVGSGVERPKAVSAPNPDFDELARRSAFEGVCVVGLIIQKDGSTSDLQVVEPIGFGLDDKAAEAISKWKFAPATRNGEPVAVEVQVEVAFRLR